MTTTSFHNRAAWQIESDQIRVTVMECGGHVAETTLKRTGVNPLWIQDRPTIDSDQYDPSIHGAIYGDDSEGRLIAGVLGHNLCIPYWGYPTEAEFRAGMTCHGETNVVRWRELSRGSEMLALQATLTESGLRVERTLRCQGPILHFETTTENLTAWDRPLAWCEHVSYGPPFLTSTQTGFYATLGKGFRTGSDGRDAFCWPEGQGQIVCDLSRFSEQTHADLVNAFLVDIQREFACFAAWNASRGLLCGYVFRAREFPWLNAWENNDSRRKTRGMEFSTTPVEGSMKALFATPRLLDTPTFEWLDAKSRISKSFFSFSLDIPRDYSGVASIRFDGGCLRIEENGRGNLIETSVSGY